MVNGCFSKQDIREKFSILHIDVNFVNGDNVNLQALSNWREEFKEAVYVCNNGSYWKKGDFYLADGTRAIRKEESFVNVFTAFSEVEKMSKSKYNVQTPDELVEKFGADTLRCYEMFLGPLEQSKPWDVQGINGVNNFLKKLWRLFHKENEFFISTNEATKENLKTLHTAIKKVSEDLNRYSFNTVVSTLMIAVNELSAQKCSAKNVLSDLVVLVAPYAPHIAEELWSKLGHASSVTQAAWPKLNESYLIEDSFEYPVSFNGKMRFKLEAPAELDQNGIKVLLMQHEKTAHYLDGKEPKKVIIVPKRIINVVV